MKRISNFGEIFDIGNANCYRNIKWIEDVSVKLPIFQQLSEQKPLIKAV